MATPESSTTRPSQAKQRVYSHTHETTTAKLTLVYFLLFRSSLEKNPTHVDPLYVHCAAKEALALFVCLFLSLLVCLWNGRKATASRVRTRQWHAGLLTKEPKRTSLDHGHRYYSLQIGKEKTWSKTIYFWKPAPVNHPRTGLWSKTTNEKKHTRYDTNTLVKHAGPPFFLLSPFNVSYHKKHTHTKQVYSSPGGPK